MGMPSRKFVEIFAFYKILWKPMKNKTSINICNFGCLLFNKAAVKTIGWNNILPWPRG